MKQSKDKIIIKNTEKVVKQIAIKCIQIENITKQSIRGTHQNQFPDFYKISVDSPDFYDKFPSFPGPFFLFPWFSPSFQVAGSLVKVMGEYIAS